MSQKASSLRVAQTPLPVFMEHPTLGFELSNWLAGLLVLVLGVIVPLVVVARHNRLFFGGGGASLPKRSH
jgi:hypothetical protein